MISLNKYHIYIHIGRPKAGSTTLQKQLFDRHSELSYYGIYPLGNIGTNTNFVNKQNTYTNSTDLQAFWDEIVQVEHFNRDKALHLFENVLKKYPPKTKKIVLSNERISSVYFSIKSIKEKLYRLNTLFPDARYFIVERDIIGFIKSQYRDHPFSPSNLSDGKPLEIKYWIDELIDKDNEIGLLSSFSEKYFDNIISELKIEYPISKVSFELLKSDKQKFATKISNILGINTAETLDLMENAHENIGVSKRFNAVRKIVRKFHLSFLANISPALTKTIKKHLKKGTKQQITIPEENIKQIRTYISKIEDETK